MPATLREMLSIGRHALSLGRSAEVLQLVLAQPRKAAQLIDCLWDENPGIANRAADVAEKLFHERPRLFQNRRENLIGLLTEATTIKVRWRLATILPRLELSSAEQKRIAGCLQSWLDEPGSIVKTCALDGLATLASRNAAFLPLALDLLRIHSRSGTPAMRARGRILLKKLERGNSLRSTKTFMPEAELVTRSTSRHLSRKKFQIGNCSERE
jgi:hypothetical protein